MKKIFLCILLFSFLAGCSAGSSQDKKVVAQINKYKMTIEDLKYEFKNAPYDEIMFLKTENGKKKYLEGIIEKEVLLQEAQRHGIDREKDFMKSIENYWEQALLRILLERKSREISNLITVYDNEIEEYYKDSGEDLPLSKVKNEIRDIIKQKKQTEAMDNWIEELRKRSYIKVDESILKEVEGL
ncbi:MAG: SurA N-terminal domain-containing protein [Candidatus Omnitrophota bacterium]